MKLREAESRDIKISKSLDNNSMSIEPDEISRDFWMMKVKILFNFIVIRVENDVEEGP